MAQGRSNPAHEWVLRKLGEELHYESLSFPDWRCKPPATPAACLFAQAFCVLGSGVLGANMGCKCLVALQLKVPHHFIKRFASGRARGVEDPGAFGAAPTTAFFDPNELACCRHYRRTTKSRVRIFCAIFLSAPPYNMQHHSVHLSGPPQESAQRSVSIRHKANPAPRKCGSTVYLWEQARTNGRRVVSQINGRFRLGPVYQLVQSSLPEVTI